MINVNSIAKGLERMRRGFRRMEKDGLAWVSAPLLTEAGALHGCTTRRGGASVAEGLASLNLGWHKERDSRENVEENYRRLSNAVGFSYESMVLTAYAHSAEICLVDGADRGKGFGNGQLPTCDGLLSADPALTMVTLHADCMPVFLYDTEAKAGGVLHAGWKGTMLRIGERAVGRLCSELRGRPERVLAAVGPAICKGHFEVDLPVAEDFRSAFGDLRGLDALPWLDYREDTGKYHIDLPMIMAVQLMMAGVPGENITLSELCTYSNGEDYYSYRRDGGNCGSMAGFMRLGA